MLVSTVEKRGGAVMDKHSPLTDLRADFLATSTRSMPLAGMLYWGVIAVAAQTVAPTLLGYLVLFGSGMIFPVGVLIDRLTGKSLKMASAANPVGQLFLRSLGLVILMWPLVIIAARAAHEVNIIVLGGAVLMGLIWIPYGWAADDPVGLRHAIGRAVLCYAAYLLVPAPFTASGIAVAVLLSYAYAWLAMRRPPADAPASA